MIQGLYIKAQAPAAPSGEWVRNPDWLEMPVISAGNNKFAGLFAVYELEANDLTVYLSGGSSTIDYGDGTVDPIANGTNQIYYYDYATLAGVVLIDKYGQNYKQAIVTITMTGNVSQLRVERENNTAGHKNNGIVPWLDIIVSCPSVNVFNVSAGRKSMILERLIILDILNCTMSNTINYTRALRVLDIPTANVTNWASGLQVVGDVKDSSNNPLNIDSVLATTLAAIFHISDVEIVGNINTPIATVHSTAFYSCINVLEIGTINAPLTTTLYQAFYACYLLKKLGVITTGPALTSIKQMFQNAYSIEDIEITDCTGVTDTFNFVINADSLKSCILTGLTIGVTVSGNLMDAAAIDALFTSLGTANGSQTINVSNNSGSAGCDPTIATAKGWTVIN